MHGPRLLLLAALVALAVPSSASAADLVIKVRNTHVSELGGFRANGSLAKFTVGAFWLYQPYDDFVQGDAPIVTAQMKGGAVDFIRADVNPPK
ncbi:MAG TPA: hypothetical protein VF024_10290 [Solirubrobacteraceae bacterium]